ncbi:MAG: beta-xylosidase [Armatimonadetes bacterium]|nr:beta-xylosidase [Armatimonadota bacterium]
MLDAEPKNPVANAKFFNAHHSPVGAFASFTFGCKGALGGLGMELKGPADEGIYIGVEDAKNPGHFVALPFFEGQEEEVVAEDYDIEGLSDYQFARTTRLFADGDVTRTFGACTDQWTAGDLTFRVASPLSKLPDPSSAPDEFLRQAFAPVVFAELTIDNRAGTTARRAFFGYAGSNRSNSMRTWRRDGVVGIAQGREIAIATSDPTAYAGVAWQPEAILSPRHGENVDFMLGNIGLVVVTVPAGELKTIRYAIGFFREGTATSGIESRYLYRRWFDNVEEVATYGLSRHSAAFRDSAEIDRRLSQKLDPVRALMAGHAIRSYLGATQMLELTDGSPLWVVNEGEYRMMNTFDLTVDQLYMELALNPWTIRNVLDLFVERYSYDDQVRFPGDEQTHPGGIAFCHDMGIGNVFSPDGHSCYEQAGLRGVFSYMSFEELVNWALCACLYLQHTDDWAWGEKHREVFARVVQSMANRDNPDSAKRNGVMGLDAARCKGGKEITTYDSLDASLGQARNNLYLAVKTWAAYALMAPVLDRLGNSDAANLARLQAEKCVSTLLASVDNEGLLPAVIGEGVEARIIPAIEGLIFPYVAGRADLVPADLQSALEKHFDRILRQGLCLFEDGGWKLSSTSRNSWLSKIYLCQFIAETILGKPADQRADQAHLSWLMDEDNAYFAWSDQMLAGKAHGSRYYPRGVTSLLWLATDSGQAIGQIESAIFG